MYKINNQGTIIRLADNANIPADAGNADYQGYLAWVAQGNTAPIDPPRVPSATELRYSSAKVTAKAIPNWATWTQAEWQTYFSANLSDAEADLVTSIAIARIMIKRQNTVINAMAKMLMAIRDQVWPDLPE